MNFDELQDGKRYLVLSGQWAGTVFVKTPVFPHVTTGMLQFGVICVPRQLNYDYDVWTLAVDVFNNETFEEL